MKDHRAANASKLWIARAVICVYALTLLLLAFVGFYILFYIILLVSFLALVSLIEKLKCFDVADAFSLRRKMLLVFVIALATRLIMLAQDQIITDDILNYVIRGERMLNGEIPYTESFYGGSKPPLHNLVLLVISGTLGAGEVQFRFVFSAVDALIAVMILFLSQNRRADRFLLSASLLYALSPVSVITVGLSGHFDPVPALAVVLSTVFLISMRHRLSALFLGLGLALKVFAAALLPYYALKSRLLKERVLYVGLFAIPMSASLLGLYLIHPQGPLNYFGETSGWGGWWSFSHLLSSAIGSKTLGSIKISWILMALFLLLILLMYISIWTRREDEERVTLFWYKVVLLISISYLGLMILDAWAQSPSGTDLSLYGVLAVFYFAIMGFIVYWYRDILFPQRLSGGRTERILVITSLAIILFCFGLPNYAPWYIIWFLPFLLAMRTHRIRMPLLFFSVWHIMGKGVSIFPGFPPIN